MLVSFVILRCGSRCMVWEMRRPRRLYEIAALVESVSGFLQTSRWSTIPHCRLRWRETGQPIAMSSTKASMYLWGLILLRTTLYQNLGWTPKDDIWAVVHASAQGWFLKDWSHSIEVDDRVDVYADSDMFTSEAIVCVRLGCVFRTVTRRTGQEWL